MAGKSVIEKKFMYISDGWWKSKLEHQCVSQWSSQQPMPVYLYQEETDGACAFGFRVLCKSRLATGH